MDPRLSPGVWLAPHTVYASIAEALYAATCLCGLDRGGATVYVTTVGPDVDPTTKEAYRVAVAAIRSDGTRWDVPAAPYEPVYTILATLRRGER